MKRLVVVLGGLLALPAFAEVAPFYYTDAVEYSDAEYFDDGVVVDDDEIVAKDDATPQKPVVKVNPRVSPSSRSGLRAGATTNVNPQRNSNANSRVVAARTTTSRTTTTTPTRGTVSRGTVSRAGANATNANVSTRRTTSAADTNVARAGAINTTTAYMSANTGAKTGVFAENNLYTGRISTRGSQNVRVPTIRVASATLTTSGDTAVSATTTNDMDSLVELTDYCKAQYTACMDNFCNVLDDNQGRCSCSKNLKNYEKTELALKAATEELQEVAQKIQYIGLTADEIETLFSETDAEEAMRGKTDNSQIKSNLDKIKNMIVDVKTGTSSIASDSSMSFDLSNLLDFTISSTGFDLSALFGTATSDTSSIANQRGETLYKTASARCKANVINSCAAQGVDAAVITNSYDLEIDKQCIAYERSLSDSNDEMSATVRNAKAVLQKARLMVAQQKNQYDLRGCISALDSCMQDDYVCGADYENCLDPSGKYIVNGQIVVGSLPGKALSGTNSAASQAGLFNDNLYDTWKYASSDSSSKNAWSGTSTGGDLAGYMEDTLKSSPITKMDTNMSKFLQYKIGYNDGSKNMGMCMSVLNKCQNYTYDKQTGKYKPDNNVVSEYLYRTFTQIKASQDALLASYAENCLSDVTSCLSSNSYDTVSNKNIAVNACKSIITTCMSVNGNVSKAPTPSEMLTWAAAVYGVDGTSIAIQNATACIGAGGTWTSSSNAAGGSCNCGSGGTWSVDADSNMGTCNKS